MHARWLGLSLCLWHIEHLMHTEDMNHKNGWPHNILFCCHQKKLYPIFCFNNGVICCHRWEIGTWWQVIVKHQPTLNSQIIGAFIFTFLLTWNLKFATFSVKKENAWLNWSITAIIKKQGLVAFWRKNKLGDKTTPKAKSVQRCNKRTQFVGFWR